MMTSQEIVAAVAEFRTLLEEAELLRDELRALVDMQRDCHKNLCGILKEIGRLQGIPGLQGIPEAPKRPALELVKNDPEAT